MKLELLRENPGREIGPDSVSTFFDFWRFFLSVDIAIWYTSAMTQRETMTQRHESHLRSIMQEDVEHYSLRRFRHLRARDERDDLQTATQSTSQVPVQKGEG